MENERPIEKLLRRYAKKRHDDAGAPPELHPATRRLLQGEVARQYPKGRGVGRGPRFWPRLSIALAVGICLAVLTAIFLPALSGSKSSSMKSLALNQSAAVHDLSGEPLFDDGKKQLKTTHSLSALEPAPATPPPASVNFQSQSAGPAVASGGVESVSVVGYVNVTNSISLSGGEVAGAPPEQPAFAFEGGKAAAEKTPQGTQTFAASDATQTVTLGPNDAEFAAKGFTYNPSLGSFARGASTDRGAGQNILSQKFMNNAVAAKDLTKAAGRAGTAAVLNNFSCEQSGNELRVLDGDGSTYSGSIEVVQTSATRRVTAGQAQSEQLDQISSQAPQSYFFSVAGTNRTLNASVIFIGNLVPQTVAQQAQHAVQQQSAARQPSVPLLQNSIIVGKARVGDGPVVEVNAVPVSQ